MKRTKSPPKSALWYKEHQTNQTYQKRLRLFYRIIGAIILAADLTLAFGYLQLNLGGLHSAVVFALAITLINLIYIRGAIRAKLRPNSILTLLGGGMILFATAFGLSSFVVNFAYFVLSDWQLLFFAIFYFLLALAFFTTLNDLKQTYSWRSYLLLTVFVVIALFLPLVYNLIIGKASFDAGWEAILGIIIFVLSTFVLTTLAGILSHRLNRKRR